MVIFFKNYLQIFFSIFFSWAYLWVWSCPGEEYCRKHHFFFSFFVSGLVFCPTFGRAPFLAESGGGTAALWSSIRPDWSLSMREKKSSSGTVGAFLGSGLSSGNELRWSSNLEPLKNYFRVKNNFWSIFFKQFLTKLFKKFFWPKCFNIFLTNLF